MEFGFGMTSLCKVLEGALECISTSVMMTGTGLSVSALSPSCHQVPGFPCPKAFHQAVAIRPPNIPSPAANAVQTPVKVRKPRKSGHGKQHVDKPWLRCLIVVSLPVGGVVCVSRKVAML